MTQADSRGIELIAPEWPAPWGIKAVFTLRSGGVSVAPYDSLNLGSGLGDSAEAVAENRRRLRTLLRLPSEPVWLEQVHGTEVLELAKDPRTSETAFAADASVTREAGVVCTIRVADCMPVLFAARDGSAIGAAHAGWRGLAAGVLEATVRRLGVPPGELLAWMGPAIGVDHFEVGDEVREAFIAGDGDAAPAFVPNARGRWQCDLYALAKRRLSSIGVSGIHGGGWCTFADPGRFFSYRRDRQCGRMAALIWMEGSAG